MIKLLYTGLFTIFLSSCATPEPAPTRAITGPPAIGPAGYYQLCTNEPGPECSWVIVPQAVLVPNTCKPVQGGVAGAVGCIADVPSKK